MKNKICKVLMILLFIIGLGIMLYPVISNYLMSIYQTTATKNYEYTVQQMEEDEAKRLIEEARRYNEKFITSNTKDIFSDEAYEKVTNEYKDILNINGIMGYIEIPKIDVKLPIYHGTSEEVLKKGIGHLETTPLPVGGIGNHSVLSGHRGLASAKLFTDLDKLEIGDEINIHILSEVLVYKVDQIKVVDPQNTSDLQAESEKDYLTLITCTPYAVNTHRLLVRGERVENQEVKEELLEDNKEVKKYKINKGNIFFKIIILIFIILILKKIKIRFNKLKNK